MPDQSRSTMNTEATETNKAQTEPKKPSEVVNNSSKGEVMEQNQGAHNAHIGGEVNMEAAITADDVMRAGGFGARDDIGSFLPAAIDSTDFEASLRDARDFEEPQGETLRPGLGWTESMDDN
ncbi:uncharacterized protein LOC109822018 isoform X2 [Asparagus officinalis]|uniref:uncharacterized protein LOC109822018 isoform X2 n=1 Tax=Asparagus officinalis TaxID=4686 RepID=UPI00098DFA1C|nr:uncharacterized protein LOC109822018 isoform X2 [Asparagus officinalis]